MSAQRVSSFFNPVIMQALAPQINAPFVLYQGENLNEKTKVGELVACRQDGQIRSYEIYDLTQSLSSKAEGHVCLLFDRKKNESQEQKEKGAPREPVTISLTTNFPSVTRVFQIFTHLDNGNTSRASIAAPQTPSNPLSIAIGEDEVNQRKQRIISTEKLDLVAQHVFDMLKRASTNRIKPFDINDVDVDCVDAATMVTIFSS